MAFSLHGIRVPHRKNTQDKPVLTIDSPSIVEIPMSMRIGAAARPIVKAGDLVKVGTKIAEADGAYSVPVHSSVSGKVVKIKDTLLANGEVGAAVVIESDGEMAIDERVAPPVVDSRESFIEAVKESGIVGLGGAGFPTHVKLGVDVERIEQLIINGAECEPYVTSDTYTMINRREDMEYAIEMMKKHLGIKHIVIGVEANKKKAIASMMKLMKNSCKGCKIDVKVLPTVYPQGGEKVLIYHTTGKAVPAGKLPIDVGCIVLNCTTLASIGEYLKTGMPLVKKCVTVDGGAVKDPHNVLAPVGTPIAELFQVCGGLCETLNSKPAKIIYGGPMMGITLPYADAPVLKNTNALLALTEKEAKLPKTTACIRCGACTNTCPFGLAPAAIAAAYENKDAALLSELSVQSCMECGCCSYTCPANRPLVQTNKLAKLFLKEEAAKEAAKNG